MKPHTAKASEEMIAAFQRFHPSTSTMFRATDRKEQILVPNLIRILSGFALPYSLIFQISDGPHVRHSLYPGMGLEHVRQSMIQMTRQSCVVGILDCLLPAQYADSAPGLAHK